MITPEELMRLAIDVCRQGIAKGNSPFGCAIALGDKVLSASHNVVLTATDITAHAEIVALRAACLKANNILLEGAIVATTCEPCPMCAAALHWARVETVYYGATIHDATESGFNEMAISALDMFAMGKSPVRTVPEFQRESCRQLFQEWKTTPGARTY